MEFSKMKPTVNQIEVHPLYLDEETVQFCAEHGIIVEAYAPFAQGNKQLLENTTLLEIAKRNEIDVHQLILLWCLQKNFVILPRSSNPERQERNIMLEGLQIPEEDIKEIDSLRFNQKDQAFKQCWNPQNII
uniref:NADP-dependent oxidoreductase domain-containing protein n=1 Tax=Strombidium rassoulzadegani TaxID=1082188 RepID=A0A7S3FYH3_9SPIT|mmetsp:Transcript_6766/g.11363  ORF Transcript_6766/g.11363 Transcript_6766/m.11363 type:complete len:132 (+) Transcript_6766:540-935(+)